MEGLGCLVLVGLLVILLASAAFRASTKKKCPYCQTSIPKGAIRCPACQKDLVPPKPGQPSPPT